MAARERREHALAFSAPAPTAHYLPMHGSVRDSRMNSHCSNCYLWLRSMGMADTSR